MISGLGALSLAGAVIPFELEPALAGPVELLVPAAAGRFPVRPEFAVRRATRMPVVWEGSPRETPLAHPAYCWMRVAYQLNGPTPWLPGRGGLGLGSSLGSGADASLADSPVADASVAGALCPGDFDLPGKREFLQTLQLGDALVARDSKGLMAFDELAAFIDSACGWRGVRAARQVLPWVRPRTDSPRETWLRQLVLDLGFAEPDVNPDVWAEGRHLTLDLAWVSLRIDLEYHGEGHFGDPRRAKGDLYRRRVLETAGWIVVEVTSADLRNPAALAARLGAAFSRARRLLGV
jgi:hypothetical protein